MRISQLLELFSRSFGFCAPFFFRLAYSSSPSVFFLALLLNFNLAPPLHYWFLAMPLSPLVFSFLATGVHSLFEDKRCSFFDHFGICTQCVSALLWPTPPFSQLNADNWSTFPPQSCPSSFFSTRLLCDPSHDFDSNLTLYQ